MNVKQHILRCAFAPILARNKRFKGRHEGETCYIFGNGASIKSMDLTAFTDHVGIGLNFLCLHKDFTRLNVPYYVLPEPFFFYPYIKNVYTKKWQKNVLGNLFKQAIAQHQNVELFTSISNFPATDAQRTFYIHHFGHRTPSRNFCDISKSFSFMGGAFYAGIGLAVNFGFKKAILVGCDYNFTPVQDGHFYSYGPARKNIHAKSSYDDLFAAVKDVLELEVITDGVASAQLPYQSYENFTGKKIHYHENHEIIAPEYLQALARAYEKQLYTAPIYGKPST